MSSDLIEFDNHAAISGFNSYLLNRVNTIKIAKGEMPYTFIKGQSKNKIHSDYPKNADVLKFKKSFNSVQPDHVIQDMSADSRFGDVAIDTTIDETGSQAQVTSKMAAVTGLQVNSICSNLIDHEIIDGSKIAGDCTQDIFQNKEYKGSYTNNIQALKPTRLELSPSSLLRVELTPINSSNQNRQDDCALPDKINASNLENEQVDIGVFSQNLSAQSSCITISSDSSSDSSNDSSRYSSRVNQVSFLPEVEEIFDSQSSNSTQDEVVDSFTTFEKQLLIQVAKVFGHLNEVTMRQCLPMVVKFHLSMKQTFHNASPEE